MIGKKIIAEFVERRGAFLEDSENSAFNSRDEKHLFFMNSKEKKTMKKLINVIAGLLLIVSAGVFAEEHAAAALEHANAAVTEGRGGHVSALVEHATVALEHAKAGDAVAKDTAKTHMDAAVESLEGAIKYGKEGHVKMATQYAEEAAAHLRAGNK